MPVQHRPVPTARRVVWQRTDEANIHIPEGTTIKIGRPTSLPNPNGGVLTRRKSQSDNGLGVKCAPFVPDTFVLPSDELFAAASERLAENQKRYRQSARGASFLLQGLLACIAHRVPPLVLPRLFLAAKR